MEAAKLKNPTGQPSSRDKEVRSSDHDKARALLSIFQTLQK